MLTNSNLPSNPKNQQEKDNEIIVKPIVYGSVAFWLGKKADDTVSHKWCVYVRGLNNEDISYFVKEVVFTLHSSFENNVRVVNKWPFELYESGWGQFDIIITIHLIDENAKPIEFVHPLKLYPSQTHASMSTKKPVVSESYDEVVFVNPKQEIREILINPPIRKESSIQIPLNFEEDRKSMDYSSISQEDKVNVERNMPSVSDRSNLKKESSLKFNTNEDKNSMNLNTQMDVVPSQTITQSLQQKMDDEMDVENFDKNSQIKDDTTSMNVEIIPRNMNPMENLSMTSANVVYINYFIKKFINIISIL
jgi:YEATS domain-containing protein 4